MNLPDDLDAFLCGEPTAEMRVACVEILKRWDVEIRLISKAATWMAYRALESRDPGAVLQAREWVTRAFAEQEHEREEFWRLRWESSLLMAEAYLRLAMGDDARRTLRGMFNLNWIVPNPPAVVNICRSMALLAAAEAKAGDFNAAHSAMRRGYDAFGCAAIRWPLHRAHLSNGGELVRASQAIAVMIALLPHCRLPYFGPIADRERILAIDLSEPFRAALQAVLPLQEAGNASAMSWQI